MADDETPEIATNETWRGIMVRARKDCGLTQTELGNRVGLSQVMISKIETGESSASSEILAICRELGIQPPQHFADEWQKKWAELGQVLRHRRPGQAEAALALIKTIAGELEAEPDKQAESEPPVRSDRRK